MIKAVVLLGIARGLIGYWVGITSRKQRIFLGEESRGFRKAQVIEQGDKFPAFYFSLLEMPRDVFKALERIQFLLKKKHSLEKEEVVIVISRQDHQLLKEILPKKNSGRYHLTELGWLIVLKGNPRERDAQEIAGKFFKKEILGKTSYEEIDKSLLHAKKRFNLEEEEEEA
jgi:hypothetical protein